MARPNSATDPRLAALADTTASAMAHAAQTRTGDPETAEALRAMARHNRIVALKLRTIPGLARDPVGLARIS